MNALCFYAIARFMPFIETEEFANVGVVLYSPSRHYFGFRVLTHRYARVTRFFEHVDGPMFRRTMVDWREELDRLALAFKTHDASLGMALWQELIKPKSSQIRFSTERVVLAGAPKVKLQELYGRYVERSFVTREYREQILNRQVAGLLRTAALSEQFAEGTVGNEEYHVKFPFIAREGDVALKVIKPLALTQPDSAAVLDHGGQWIQRVRNLSRRHLMPGKLLFAFDGDDQEDGLLGDARRSVVAELRDLGGDAVRLSDQSAVIAFAG